jgi:uncharacterized membrane protein YhaH (DUF805 family)/RNA polymerase subunit RPABC4/transcription elongation factor Spt4
MSDVQEKGVDEIYCPSCRAIIKKEAELCPKCGVPRTKWRNGPEVFCSSCGEKIKGEAEICPKCGVRQKTAGDTNSMKSGGVKNGWTYFADAMKKYAVFSGRTRRAEFWWYALCVFSINIGAYAIGSIINFPLLNTIVSLAFLVPGIAVFFRRMHDVGKPGGFCFIPIYDIILAVRPGDTGKNSYGPDPKVDP